MYADFSSAPPPELTSPDNETDVVLFKPPFEIEGNITLVYRRADTDFIEVTKQAMDSGAVALVIANDKEDLECIRNVREDGYKSQIPVLMIKPSDAGRLLNAGNGRIRDAGEIPCISAKRLPCVCAYVNVRHDFGVAGADRPFETTTGEALLRMGAQKVGQLIDKATGGVLCIDEAYALDPAGSREGAAAAMQLLDAAEKRRETLTIILAGCVYALCRRMER